MFIYVEHITRRPGIALDDFRALTGYTQPRWAELFPEDELLLNLGRTWRIGPEPEYLAVWLNRSRSLGRLDEWAATFADVQAIPDLPVAEHGFLAAARIERAAVMAPLAEPVAGASRVYYAEAFEPAPEADPDALREAFAGRTPEGGTLHLLATRVGLLGVDPALAIWGADTFAQLGPTTATPGAGALARPLRGALYANLGEEIL